MSLRGQSVVVTGACGFIGSHLVEALVQRGARVKALVVPGQAGASRKEQDALKELAVAFVSRVTP